MTAKIVLVELNEVPFRVLDEFCSRYPHSSLARCLPRCQQFETISEDGGHLSPWVTWPSLHRGVPNERHGIGCFGEDLREADGHFPPLWQLLAERGVSTGVFGSLHSYGSLPAIESSDCRFYVPDTFAAGSECFPERLSAFQRFNLAMVEGSARNVSSRVCWRPALELFRQAPALGLRGRTLAGAALQLATERLRPARRSRRRTWQALVSFDLFYKQLASTRPAFATFFTNHVASAMHRFWAARFPHDYRSFGLDGGWVTTYRDEIDYALRKLDGCLARLFRLAERGGEYAIWIATSMGQAATTAEPVATQLYITDLEKFTARLGLPQGSWSRRPAMAPDVNLVVSPSAEEHFADRLAELRIAGRTIEHRRAAGGFFSLRLGQPDLAARENVISLDGRPLPLEELGMSHVAIDEQSSTTAYHIPQGMLLVFDPRRAPAQRAGRTQISTLDIAPALLRHFAVTPPAYMRSSRISAAA